MRKIKHFSLLATAFFLTLWAAAQGYTQDSPNKHKTTAPANEKAYNKGAHTANGTTASQSDNAAKSGKPAQGKSKTGKSTTVGTGTK